MKEVIEKIKGMNNYYAGDYKIIKNYLTGRYICTDNEVFKNELLRLEDELINKQISNINILNQYYNVYMRSRLKFDNFKTLEEKQNHMQYGQLIYYIGQLQDGKVNFDWIEIDKNIVQEGNIYYLKDTKIKLFEDVEVSNQGEYYYVCDSDIALDVNNIQKVFSNEIMNLDYLTKSFYNTNKIFFFSKRQQKRYNFKVDLSKYKIYKRIYFVNVEFKEIYFIKENEIDINDVIDVDVEKKHIKPYIYGFMKKNIIESRKELPFMEDYNERLKVLKDYNVSFKKHLLALTDTQKDFHDNYVVIKDSDGIHKVYLDNSYDRYFHATGLESAKNMIKEGFATNNDILDFDYNKLFFSPNIYTTKYYGAIGGLNTDYNANTKYIIFECNLDDYEDKLYHYIHTVEYFIYDNKLINPCIIKRIWLVEDDIIKREISVEELLKMGV